MPSSRMILLIRMFTIKRQTLRDFHLIGRRAAQMELRTCWKICHSMIALRFKRTLSKESIDGCSFEDQRRRVIQLRKQILSIWIRTVRCEFVESQKAVLAYQQSLQRWHQSHHQRLIYHFLRQERQSRHQRQHRWSLLR